MWVEAHGKRIFGQLYVPSGTAKPKGAVICSHPFGGTHRNGAEYASAFADAGITAFAFDFCGGSPASMSSGKTTDASLRTERDDLLDVIDAVKALDLVNEQKVFLEGQSQGGAVSVLAAAERPCDVAGLVLMYPAFVIPEDMKRRFGSEEGVPKYFDLWMRLGKVYAVDAMGIDFAATASRCPMPALIYQGTDDDIEPAEATERVATRFPNAQLNLIRGAGHGFYGDVQKRIIEESVSFMLRN